MTLRVSFGTLADMENFPELMAEVERYAAERGVSPSTVCRLATNNPRLFERMKRRAAQIEADAARVKKFMDQHPINSAGPQ